MLFDLGAADIHVDAVHSVEPTIEDVFFQLTERSSGQMVG
jgi:hypothetical protein